MKIRLIALAALAAVGSAHAISPTDIETLRTAGTLKEIYIAGGSAQRLFLGAWFQNQCKPETFDVFFDGTTTTPTGANHRAYSCRLAVKVGNYAINTPVVLYKRDAGGSYQGVGPVATNTAQAFMHVGTGNCIATTNTTTSDITVPTYACDIGTGKTDNVVAHAGVSDVEPLLLTKAENLPGTASPVPTAAQVNGLDRAPINQTIMGIIVNKRAYLALQKTQGLVDMGATSIDESAAKQPSLPSAWVASVLGGLASGNVAGGNGWGNVISSTVDPDVEGKAVNYCRRTVGSGTQASVDAVLLRTGCQTGSFTIYPAGQTPGAANGGSNDVTSMPFSAMGGFNIRTNSSGGNLITCVGGAAGTNVGDTTSAEGTAGAYGLGLLSRENSPVPNVGGNAGKDLGFRFVKLDGAAPARDTAKVGGYSLLFNATMQFSKTGPLQSDANAKLFITTLRSTAGASSHLAAADVDTQEGILANPNTWTGAYKDLATDAEKKFASRTDRFPALTCSPLRVVK